MLKIYTSLSATLLILSSTVSFASGSYSSSSSQKQRTSNTPTIKPINSQQQAQKKQDYESGKHIYNGGSEKIGKFKYCIDTGTQKQAVNRAWLRQFKGKSFSSFASKLNDCDSLEMKMSSHMSNRDLKLVVHYLNERHSIGLKP